MDMIDTPTGYSFRTLISSSIYTIIAIWLILFLFENRADIIRIQLSIRIDYYKILFEK